MFRKKSTWLIAGVIICLVFLHKTNPNRKQDLKRYMDDNGELWLSHELDDRFFFTIHSVTTADIWKARGNHRTFIGFANNFWIVSKKQKSYLPF